MKSCSSSHLIHWGLHTAKPSHECCEIVTTPRFRSIRRRLLWVIAPLTLVAIGLLSAASARAVRAVATPVIVNSAKTLIRSLSAHVRNAGSDRAAIRKVLEEHITDRVNSGFALVEAGRPPLIVGNLPNLEVTIADGRKLLAHNERGVLVHDLGPLSTWAVSAERLDDDRFLVFEHRLHGPGTHYTAAALSVTAAAVLVSLGLALLLAHKIYRPLVDRLNTLESALTGYGKGNSQTRLNPGEDMRDELDSVFEAFNDMTQHITTLEDERAQQIEAERALLADLAHDINTPITVLRGYAETLLDSDAGLSDDDRLSIHTEILGQSLYVQAIVDDLLTMASARSAHLRINQQQVDLDALFDAVVDSFLPMATQRGLALIGDAGELHCQADPVRLRQILTNLVRNALLHATGATLIELSATVQGSGILLSVRDDGPGVPAEAAPHLFDRHRRAPGVTSAGWGLGLAIVKTLSELHGGTATHRPGNPGSCFEIWLPNVTQSDLG